MKILGEIGGNELVLDKTDKYAAYEVVDALPVASEYPGNAVIVSSTNLLYIKVNAAWVEVQDASSEEYVDGVNTLRYPMVSNDVRIHWKDPEDKGDYHWKFTRVMRKYGSYPTSIHDGVLVVDSYVHNFYNENYLHDFLPPGTEDQWYYKIWTFTDDGISYSDANCQFKPIAVTWSTISSVIKAGNAEKIFAAGDVITLSTGSDKWGNVDFEVVAFDNFTSSSVTHSMTLLTKDVVISSCNWDKVWPTHKLTSDVIVLDANKYYVKTGTTFTHVTLELGSVLTPGVYYEKLDSAFNGRMETGGNKYSDSLIRKWLVATSMVDGISLMPPAMAFADVDDGAFLATVKASNVITALPEIDGRGYSTTQDRFFLLSQTELIGVPSTQEWYVQTTDKNRIYTKSYYMYVEATGTYVDAMFDPTTDDFITGVTYYEKNESIVYEGKAISYLTEDADNRIRCSSGNPQMWWTRSAMPTTDHFVQAVGSDGELIENVPVINDEDTVGLALACVIA